MSYIFEHRVFDKKKDEKLLRSFAKMRSLKLPENLMFLPPTGIVVLWEKQPVCMGFLIKCDNNMAIHSDFLSDPNFTKGVRNEAAQYMRKILAVEAQRSNLPFITAFTKHEKLSKRLQALGYTKIDEGFTQVGRFLWL